MRFHVIALPHTKTTKEYVPCAFTQKVRNFCRMMHGIGGHEVYHYGAEGSEADCTEHIDCITDAEQRQFFGGDEWKAGRFFPIDFNPALPYWQLFNGRAIEALRARLQPQDFICVIGGYAHKPIADAFPNHITVEFGIGYEGSFARFRVFESYAWMHYLYGREGTLDGQAFDAVIPNYIDPEDFPLQEQKGDHALFVARLIERKGAQEAVDATRAAGMRLLMAGQGYLGRDGDTIHAQGFDLTGAGHVEHIGVLDAAQRATRMGQARVLIMPTRYIGPFEGVAVEAMACGTPVVTTDWGAFAETVMDGITGYRCRTLGEMTWALRALGSLIPAAGIRTYAVGRYGIQAVQLRYEDYFTELLKLWRGGWYEPGYAPWKRDEGGFL